MKKKFFVTSALPYANGDLHLGHMLEFIQTDIWVRYNKQYKNDCIFISGIDAHGTPVMLKSVNMKLSFECLINRYFLSHKSDLSSYSIGVDYYYTTHSYENELLSRKFFRKLFERKYIFLQKIDQLYDVTCSMFLPDRYVLGTCPKCKTKNQYGDMCGSCNNKYDAIELLNPVSVLSKSRPIMKESYHYFFDLSKFKIFLSTWCTTIIFQKSILNKLNEWLNADLKAWDISRDYPYFGFKIPSEFKKFFYVWLDAPIGYISNFLKFLLKNDLIFLNEFNSIKSFDTVHFIGKDIVYFHALFWLAVLNGTRFKLCNKIHVHGFLTVDGLKMSKSSDTYIMSKNFATRFHTDCLRFYFASKLNENIVDVDFNLLDFIEKINSDLIGKFLNIISRCSKILIKHFNSFLSLNLDNYFLFEDFIKINKLVHFYYKKCNYSKVISCILKYTEKINIYLDNEKPWILIKSNKTFQKAQAVCTTAINLFLILLLNLQPIIPSLAKNVWDMFCLDDIKFFSSIKFPLVGKKIFFYTHILRKIDYKT